MKTKSTIDELTDELKRARTRYKAQIAVDMKECVVKQIVLRGVKQLESLKTGMHNARGLLKKSDEQAHTHPWGAIAVTSVIFFALGVLRIKSKGRPQ